ncbi:hypothetical protein ACA910_000286 [Epithemia clementina (nom. ined.)]
MPSSSSSSILPVRFSERQRQIAARRNLSAALEQNTDNPPTALQHHHHQQAIDNEDDENIPSPTSCFSSPYFGDQCIARGNSSNTYQPKTRGTKRPRSATTREQGRVTATAVVTPEPSLSWTPVTVTSGAGSSTIATKDKNYNECDDSGTGWLDFRDLKVPPQELRPSATLTTGQCFIWKDVTSPPTLEQQDDSSSSSSLGPEPTTSAAAPQIKTSAWGVHNAKEWIGTLRVVPWRDDDEEEAEEKSGSFRDGADTVVVHLKETPDTTMYQVLAHHRCDSHREENDDDDDDFDDPFSSAEPPPPPCFYDDMLRDYFQLNEPLQPLYEEWSTQCPRMHQIAQSIPGVRVLQQDPWECLISFICSSNNNIPRITSMLQSIRQRYGRSVTLPPPPPQHASDEAAATPSSFPSSFYTFPSPQQLSVATEADLRKHCGLGYRAKYIVETTQKVLEWGGESALWALRKNKHHYPEVRAQLLQLSGVGPKVADCVALFSLAQDTHAIPVDVHVWNICLRDYAASASSRRTDNNSRTDQARLQEIMENKVTKQQQNKDVALGEEHNHDNGNDILLKAKSLTPKLYQRVQDIFRKQFPNKTGWAHSLLFVAELPSFRPALPQSVLEEMDEFRKQEQASKKKLKESKEGTTPKKKGKRG